MTGSGGGNPERSTQSAEVTCALAVMPSGTPTGIMITGRPGRPGSSETYPPGTETRTYTPTSTLTLSNRADWGVISKVTPRAFCEEAR